MIGYENKKIGVMTLAKVEGLMGLIIGVILALIITLVFSGGIFGKVLGPGFGLLAGLLYAAGITFVLFVGGLVKGLLYNFIAGKFGGIEIETE